MGGATEVDTSGGNLEADGFTANNKRKLRYN